MNAVSSLNLPLNPGRILMLGAFAVACWLLIPQENYLAGAAAWAISLTTALTDPSRELRRRMGVLLGCVAILALAPINTDTRPIKFLTLGGSFLAVIVLGDFHLSPVDRFVAAEQADVRLLAAQAGEPQLRDDAHLVAEMHGIG